VKAGDNLNKISKTFQSSVIAIKTANHLKSDVLHANQLLMIPQSDSKTLPPATIKKNTITEDRLPGPKEVIYTVKKHDTAWSICNKFHVKMPDLRFWNHLPWKVVVHEGEKLELWVRR
jgi:LysM repeat protein